MTEIRQWAYAVTISAIVGAIILSVSPGGSTEKLVRAAVSLFLMCAILSPFLKGADPMELLNGIEIPEVQSSESGGKETAESRCNLGCHKGRFYKDCSAAAEGVIYLCIGIDAG